MGLLLPGLLLFSQFRVRRVGTTAEWESSKRKDLHEITRRPRRYSWKRRACPWRPSTSRRPSRSATARCSRRCSRGAIRSCFTRSTTQTVRVETCPSRCARVPFRVERARSRRSRRRRSRSTRYRPLATFGVDAQATSTALHCLPPLWTFATRWADGGAAFDRRPALGAWYCSPILAYCVWQLLYVVKTEVLDAEYLEKTPDEQTALRWLTRDERNGMHRICKFVCVRTGAMARGARAARAGAAATPRRRRLGSSETARFDRARRTSARGPAVDAAPPQARRSTRRRPRRKRRSGSGSSRTRGRAEI